MQLILDNQEQFDPEVVDKALEGLNNSMHKPLVSQDELDAAAEAASAEFDKQESLRNSNTTEENYVSSQDIDELLNKNPIDDYIQ